MNNNEKRKQASRVCQNDGINKSSVVRGHLICDLVHDQKRQSVQRMSSAVRGKLTEYIRLE